MAATATQCEADGAERTTTWQMQRGEAAGTAGAAQRGGASAAEPAAGATSMHEDTVYDGWQLVTPIEQTLSSRPVAQSPSRLSRLNFNMVTGHYH